MVTVEVKNLGFRNALYLSPARHPKAPVNHGCSTANKITTNCSARTAQLWLKDSGTAARAQGGTEEGGRSGQPCWIRVAEEQSATHTPSGG